MQNFQNTFETRKRSFVSAFSFCMTVPLICQAVMSKIKSFMSDFGAV